MGEEHNGRVRGLGLAPTARSYFGVTSYNVGVRQNDSSSSCQSDEVNSLKEQLQVMTSKYEEFLAKNEETSQILIALSNFVSQQFPGHQWMPTQLSNCQVVDTGSSRRVPSNNSSHWIDESSNVNCN